MLPRLPSLTLPPSAGVLAVIALAFVLPGLAGHDPWKSHDLIGIGIAHGMAASGDGIVPSVAGMPWLFDPPLFHWLGWRRLRAGTDPRALPCRRAWRGRSSILESGR